MTQPSEPPRYSRDMRGYGATPNVSWPDRARIAVQIVVNYEEGGERCLLHGDDESEAFLSEIIGADPWPGARHWNMESLYEYGARAGFWRLYRVLTDAGVPVTVFGVASALARAPEQVAAMLSADWEIASHGLKWIDHRLMPYDEERQQMQAAIDLHQSVVGVRPEGWYTGRCSMQTVQIAAEEGGFAYIADSYADDLPYWHPLGQQMGDRHQLIVPYTLDANDMRFATNQGFNTGQDFAAYLKDSFDTLYQEGSDGRPVMLSVGLHCRLAGRPGRTRGLQHFLEHVLAHDHVWLARRIDIANYWARTYPPALPSLRPATLNRSEFLDAFGGIFEHSPWIAEQAWHDELGPAHNSAIGLHHALCRVFRSASRDRRLSVLNAHPDLAGKLAAAKLLTEQSTGEQASAGLDRLTAQERATFMQLNQDYRDRHGFPFIIAVRDYTRAQIMREFGQRIANTSEDEFAMACAQVERIAWYRVKEILD